MNAFFRAPVPLLEREQCLAHLEEWMSATERGGCIALVCGEAGIGKTALVHEFARRQRIRRVLWGACDALFTPRSLAPLHDMARQTKGALLDAFSSATNREAIFNAAFDELARGTPTLVVFEDVQWADEATLDLLKFLARRINRTRAMLVVTYRDNEVGPRHPLRFVIGDLPRPLCHRLALSPLTEPAVAKLARQAGRCSANLHSMTGGNPFFVTEVLAAGEAEAVPVAVRDAVLARAVRLSPAARKIAELVSVVPGKSEAWLLERAVGLHEAAIEGCLSVGVIRNEDGSLAFRHELARRALEDSLSEGRRRDLHAKVLGILAPRADVPAARLAYHAHECRNAKALLRYAPIAAAHAASAGAHREAAAHYQTALRYAEHLEPQALATLNGLSSWRLHILACSARSKLEQGDWPGSCEDIDAVLRSPGAAATTRLAALTALAQLRIRRGDADPDSPLEEAQALAGSLRQMQGLATLAVARAEAAWLAEDREGVVRAVRPVYDLARQKLDPSVNGELAVWLHRVDSLDGEATQFARPYALEISGEWRAAANIWNELGCPYERATLLALHGSEIEKREALEIFERLGASSASRVLRRQFRAEGVKGVPRGARASTQSNQHGLTRREAEVLTLLSQGMRNSAIAKRLFVSQKTVDHHVSAILGKLGVPSRGEAAVVTRLSASM